MLNCATERDEKYTVHISTDLSDFTPDEWNALSSHSHPFTQYQFLHALEQYGCCNQYGWYPNHIALRNQQGTLCAAMPAYLKTNNYGEFVFDRSWEQSYMSQGINYYPKIVIAIPYTPVTGERLLCSQNKYKPLLIAATVQLTKQQDCSGAHCLFFPDEDKGYFEQASFAFRLGCQYHWHNNGYHTFGDFLGTLRSKKRKMIQRERRLVREQKIKSELLHGPEISTQQWQKIHELYRRTFETKSGVPTLSRAFFESISRNMPQNLVVAIAQLDNQIIACAINFRSNDTLYGRYWGAEHYYDCLHFESCYYLGIDYCIRHGLKRFESGAQGEHKISRGFLPVETWSAHWLQHSSFMQAATHFCLYEKNAVAEYIKDCHSCSPYRRDTIPLSQPL